MNHSDYSWWESPALSPECDEHSGWDRHLPVFVTPLRPGDTGGIPGTERRRAGGIPLKMLRPRDANAMTSGTKTPKTDTVET